MTKPFPKKPTSQTSGERARAKRLADLFNITPGEYDQILRFQGGVCAICGLPPKSVRLSVDHNHKTGLVRGLLCWQCNKFVLAMFDKRRIDPRRLYDYITRSPASAALGAPRYGRIGPTEKRRRKSTKRTTTTRKKR